MTWAIDVNNIPDFDQRRAALPNNGNMYCAPTSTFNNVYFMGKHGYPELLNSLLDPDNVILNLDGYTGIGIRLAQMGAHDGTDPFKGGSQKGTASYLSSLSSDQFNVLTYYKTPGFPRPDTMALWLSIGGLVTVCYGRYAFPYEDTKIRVGGHCVTLCGLTTKSSANPWGDFTIRYRDPASDEGKNDPDRLSKQSPFRTTERQLHPEAANFDGTSTVLYGIGNKPPETKPDDPFWPQKIRYAYIDGYQVIVPLLGLSGVSKTVTSSASAAPGGSASPSPAAAVNGPARLSMLMSARFDREAGYGAPTTADLSSLIPKNVVDIAFDRIRPTAVVAAAKGMSLTEVDLAHRTARTLAQLPKPAQRIVFGGDDGALFVLMGDTMARLERDGKLRSVPVPAGLEAIGFDDASRQVVAAGTAGMFVFGEHLELRSKRDVPLAGHGKLTMQVDSALGQVMTLREGDASIRCTNLDAARVDSPGDIALGNALRPVTFALGPNGVVLVNDNGFLREYSHGKVNDASRLHNMQVGDIMAFPRNIDNADDAGVRGPKWDNVPPDEAETEAAAAAA